MPTERGSNGATTSINQSGGITSSATSVTVAASTSAGFPNLTAAPGQFRVQVEQELWLVTATTGTDGVNWTITRHIEGTTAAAHVNGSQVVQKLTWAALENLAASGGTPAASAVTFTPAGGIAATDVQAALQEVDTEKAPKASPTFTGVVTTPALAVSGLTGSLSASRYVGATASGAPVSGTFAIGDFVIARNGHVWICTTAGTPGTWADAGGGGGGSGGGWQLVYDHTVPMGGEDSWAVPFPAGDVRAARYVIHVAGGGGGSDNPQLSINGTLLFVMAFGPLSANIIAVCELWALAAGVASGTMWFSDESGVALNGPFAANVAGPLTNLDFATFDSGSPGTPMALPEDTTIEVWALLA